MCPEPVLANHRFSYRGKVNVSVSVAFVPRLSWQRKTERVCGPYYSYSPCAAGSCCRRRISEGRAPCVAAGASGAGRFRSWARRGARSTGTGHSSLQCVQETFSCELPLRLSRACLGKSCVVSRTLPTLATRGKKTEEEARGVFLVLFFCLVVYISPAVSPVLARNFQASSISPPPAETTRLLFKFSKTTFKLYVCPEPVLANTRLLA